MLVPAHPVVSITHIIDSEAFSLTEDSSGESVKIDIDNIHAMECNDDNPYCGQFTVVEETVLTEGERWRKME